MLFGGWTCSKPKFSTCGVNLFGHTEIKYGTAVAKRLVQAVKEGRVALGSSFEGSRPRRWEAWEQLEQGPLLTSAQIRRQRRGRQVPSILRQDPVPPARLLPEFAHPPKTSPPPGDRVFRPESLWAHFPFRP